MKINLYQVYAFTNHLFGGNPAAICPLSAWLPDELLQSSAARADELKVSWLLLFWLSFPKGICVAFCVCNRYTSLGTRSAVAVVLSL